MSDPYYNGGGGGGGFMAGGSQGGSQAQKRSGNQSLRPVTIKQFNQASQAHPDAEFTVDDVDVASVTIVGVVRNVASQATNITLSLEDGTGSCEAKLWLATSDEEDPRMVGIQQDIYVRAIGTIKVFANKRHFAAQSIRPVTDHNEVFYHLLECQLVSLQLRRGKPGSGNDPTGVYATSGSNTLDYSMGNNAGGGDDRSGEYANLAPIHRAIMKFCSNNPPEDGFHIAHVAQNLVEYDNSALVEATEFLLSEGHLYTSSDEMHVLPTS
ncbi:Single-stranded DNA-binding replication protein A (RPA), medium (30 kD) subunit [Phaffia rhodozyma]|uniref:Single-stranded DNA-binding replication protein A (RPA), medium (30 kD) subunit n=1 Tax=Phaffia rhodozyma TaxID=264483 RepID=A0A0F7SN40_PHARH|nr:Single-stranded DNA-binding replication protein A (RPA), medium (30 kD) subunit [Phaffia rhodozyma]